VFNRPDDFDPGGLNGEGARDPITKPIKSGNGDVGAVFLNKFALSDQGRDAIFRQSLENPTRKRYVSYVLFT